MSLPAFDVEESTQTTLCRLKRENKTRLVNIVCIVFVRKRWELFYRFTETGDGRKFRDSASIRRGGGRAGCMADGVAERGRGGLAG